MLIFYRINLSIYLSIRFRSYLRCLCLFTYGGVQHILCCVFVLLHLVYHPCCLWIVVLFFFILCTPYVASFSGLSFCLSSSCVPPMLPVSLDCRFVCLHLVYLLCCQFLWIVVLFFFILCTPYVASFSGLSIFDYYTTSVFLFI